jgi:hypothetical protein
MLRGRSFYSSPIERKRCVTTALLVPIGKAKTDGSGVREWKGQQRGGLRW